MSSSGTPREKVVTFGPQRGLVGLLTPAPRGAPAGRPAILLLNSGTLHRVGPNRMYVHMARRFAAAGFPVLRFDLSGIGDSAPRRDSETLERATALDVGEAITFALKATGAPGVILGGLCLGADISFAYAPGDERVHGVVLLDAFIHRTARYHVRSALGRLTSARSWANMLAGRNTIGRMLRGRFGPPPGAAARLAALPAEYKFRRPSRDEMHRQMATLAGRGTRLFAVFTGAMEDWYNYQGQFAELFGDCGWRARPTIHYWAGCGHTFGGAWETKLLDAIVAWLASWPAAEPAPAAGADPARRAATLATTGG